MEASSCLDKIRFLVPSIVSCEAGKCREIRVSFYNGSIKKTEYECARKVALSKSCIKPIQFPIYR